MPYADNTIRRAEQILGYGITDTAGSREFTVIDGVIYTDIFTGTPTIPGYTGTIKKAFNGRKNGMTYWNELIVEDCKLKTVELSLSWGSTDFMTDIDGLLQWLEDNPPAESLDDSNVQSKKIEDFSVSFKNSEESQSSLNTILHEGFGFYIRRPLIISVTKEQRHDYRYF